MEQASFKQPFFTKINMAISLRPALPSDDEFLLSVHATTRTDEMDLVDWNTAQKSHFCGCSAVHLVIVLATGALIVC